ncbi:MAG: prepilin-type N-terminal cleavage/methylation domain-containing protein [Planctomycetes bacterium]|nr:prepilin-type N-terminal cleavage/methylation domain-containing protein [Planctomycetota bacterium]
MNRTRPISIRPRRPGYTLIELLVVIAIIGVLASLGAWGIFAVIASRQESNTRATLQVLNKMLQDRWAKVVADAKKERPSPAASNLSGYTSGLDPTGERARVIWIKARLAEAFPQSFAEIDPTNPNSIVNLYIPTNRRKPHFAKYQTTIAPNYAARPTESSALLLMALNALQNADGVRVEDQLGHAVADSDSDGVKELVDGWGHPLYFFRFPWNNSALQQATPATGNAANARFADPIDTGGSLINRNWYPTALRYNAAQPQYSFEPVFHPVGPSPIAPSTVPARAFFTTPTIVSAGRDARLDLATDLSSTGLGSLDNIYSFQLRGE